MDRSESRPYTLGGLWIPLLRLSSSETLSLRDLRRASQVPRLIFRHAPSPTTPDSPTGSYARLSPVSGRLHHLREVGHCHLSVTRPNQVRLRWARVFVVRVGIHPLLSLFRREPALLPTSGYPRVTGRDYMLNEQFTCLTPFSQIDQPGLAWRTEAAKIAKGFQEPVNID
jgi:hypothetical protein